MLSPKDAEVGFEPTVIQFLDDMLTTEPIYRKSTSWQKTSWTYLRRGPTTITTITKNVSKQLANVAQQQPNNAKKVNNGLSNFIIKL